MKKTLCHYHGCYASSLPGKHYCARHSHLENSWGRRPAPVRRKSSQWHHLYNSARWRQVSRDFLSRYPVCFICGMKATVADHITPHRGNLDLFYDMDNLQPLCWKCHSAKTLKENEYFKSTRGGRGVKK